MIVDCHTQIWDATVRSCLLSSAERDSALRADAAHHLEAVGAVDRAFVLGFKSAFLQTEIPNRYVADHVRRNSSKLIGFAGVDPTDSAWHADLRLAFEEMGFRGVTTCPALQNYHPADTRAMELYEQCAARGFPIIIDHSLPSPAARMEFARPMLLDEVAREFPQLKLVVAHLGHPWIEETLALLAKHEHVYANIAGLLRRPWISYNALRSAFEMGVMGKLLFGSDFPRRSPAACIETLYSINQFSHGTSLPPVPREQLRGVVERDALSLLGLEPTAARPGPGGAKDAFDDE